MLKHDRTTAGLNGRVSLYLKRNGFLVVTKNKGVKKEVHTKDRDSAMRVYRHYEGMT